MEMEYESNIEKEVAKNMNFQECQRQCNADRNCSSWTWLDLGNGHFYLKQLNNLL